MKKSHLAVVEAALVASIMIGVVVINVAGLTKTATPPRVVAQKCLNGSTWIPERNTCTPPDIARLAN